MAGVATQNLILNSSGPCVEHARLAPPDRLLTPNQLQDVQGMVQLFGNPLISAQLVAQSFLRSESPQHTECLAFTGLLDDGETSFRVGIDVFGSTYSVQILSGNSEPCGCSVNTRHGKVIGINFDSQDRSAVMRFATLCRRIRDERLGI